MLSMSGSGTVIERVLGRVRVALLEIEADYRARGRSIVDLGVEALATRMVAVVHSPPLSTKGSAPSIAAIRRLPAGRFTRRRARAGEKSNHPRTSHGRRRARLSDAPVRRPTGRERTRRCARRASRRGRRPVGRRGLALLADCRARWAKSARSAQRGSGFASGHRSGAEHLLRLDVALIQLLDHVLPTVLTTRRRPLPIPFHACPGSPPAALTPSQA
jgi:hypothetical protein